MFWSEHSYVEYLTTFVGLSTLRRKSAFLQRIKISCFSLRPTRSRMARHKCKGLGRLGESGTKEAAARANTSRAKTGPATRPTCYQHPPCCRREGVLYRGWDRARLLRRGGSEPADGGALASTLFLQKN